jgi:2,4-dienoyl-CoA reductase-like NADH-dependent reductase (Old Yellow Enzyme family)
MLLNFATDRGEVTERLTGFYQRCAAGGYGLVVTECTFVRFKGGISTRGIALYDDRFLPGVARLASAVHTEGSRLGVQIFFDGAGRTFASDETVSIGPSDLTPWGGPFMSPMTAEDILGMAEDFARAARLARQAGADLVELHMGHAHLLGRFLSPYFNRRDDEFGGSRDRRLHFPLLVVKRVLEETGGTLPVTARLSLTEQIPGGIDLEEAIGIVGALKSAGVSAVHTSAGTGTTPKGLASIFPTSFSPQAPFAELAKRMRRETGMQTIFAGKVVTPGEAQRLLDEGVADLISVGRAGLADPDWPNKATGSGQEPLTPCISCNQGCVDQLVSRKEITCTVNPLVGFEVETRSISKLSRRDRYLIVGGGVAGLSCAAALARRGASVTLYESGPELGGQYRWIRSVPGKEQFGLYLDYLVQLLAELEVEVRTGATLREDGMEAGAGSPPAATFWAGGAVPKPWQSGTLAVPIVDGWQAFESLANLNDAQVVVVGAGQVGSDVAMWLASRGNRVTVVDKLEDPLALMNSRQYDYRRTFEDMGISLATNSLAEGGEGSELHVRNLGNSEESLVHADTVVNATGRISRARPEFLSQAIAIGDGLRVGNALDAIRQGTFHGAWTFRTGI